MSRDEACPHGVMGGCDECIMRKGNTIAAALAMLPIRRPGPPPGVRLANVNGHMQLSRDGAVVIKDLEQVVALVPEMLALLRDAGQWYCGELPDGTDRREAIAALIARIDKETP